MNLNFSNFLSTTLKFLNIANRAIPLIKEMKPTLDGIKRTVSNIKTSQTILPADSQRKPLEQVNNSLTFFR